MHNAGTMEPIDKDDLVTVTGGAGIGEQLAVTAAGAAGTAIGGPIGGVIGSIAGEALVGLFGGKDKKKREQMEAMQAAQAAQAPQQMASAGSSLADSGGVQIEIRTV